MSLRKQPRKAGHGTGQVSLKTEGHVIQTIRMRVEDNNNVRQAAELADMSINSWAAAALSNAATSALKKGTAKNGKANS